MADNFSSSLTPWTVDTIADGDQLFLNIKALLNNDIYLKNLLDTLVNGGLQISIPGRSVIGNPLATTSSSTATWAVNTYIPETAGSTEDTLVAMSGIRAFVNSIASKALVWRGAFNAANTYTVNNLVSFAGNFYLYTGTGTSAASVVPPVSDKWTVFIQNKTDVLVKATGHGLTVGQPVYYVGGTAIWRKAIASSLDSIATHIVTTVINADYFIVSSEGFCASLAGTSTTWLSQTVLGGTTPTIPENGIAQCLTASNGYIRLDVWRTGTTSGGSFDGTADSILLNPLTVNPEADSGRVFFSEAKDTMAFFNSAGLQTVGDNIRQRVHNTTTADIPKHSIVFISGETNGIPSIELAIAGSDRAKCTCMGITTAAIPAGTSGWMLTKGRIDGVNTGGLKLGVVFVSSDVNGALTSEEPAYPFFSAKFGRVLEKSSSNGVLYVDPDTDPQYKLGTGTGALAGGETFPFFASSDVNFVPNYVNTQGGILHTVVFFPKATFKVSYMSFFLTQTTTSLNYFRAGIYQRGTADTLLGKTNCFTNIEANAVAPVTDENGVLINNPVYYNSNFSSVGKVTIALQQPVTLEFGKHYMLGAFMQANALYFLAKKHGINTGSLGRPNHLMVEDWSSNLLSGGPAVGMPDTVAATPNTSSLVMWIELM